MASMKDWVVGRLEYNGANDRYGLLRSGLWEHDGFHCGDCLQVLVNGKWVDTRFEMLCGENGNEWYLVGTLYRGASIRHVQARIKKWVEVD